MSQIELLTVHGPYDVELLFSILDHFLRKRTWQVEKKKALSKLSVLPPSDLPLVILYLQCPKKKTFS